MLERDTEFYKGLAFLPLVHQHADTHTNVHRTVTYCCFLMPTTSDPDKSKSSGYGCQLKLLGKTACKWRCKNQTESDQMLRSIPVSQRIWKAAFYLTAAKSYNRAPNTILFFPWFCFPFHFCVLKFDLLSCIPQSVKERDKKFSSYVSMGITKKLSQHFWL